MNNIDVFYRTKPLILISLYTSTLFNSEKTLNKYEIQKIIFLTLYSSSISEILIQKLNFHFYKKGPYTQMIQRGLESLFLEGYVNIEKSIKSHRKTLEDYSITKKGIIKAKDLINSYATYRLMYDTSLGVSTAIDIAGWEYLVDIVYCIPDIEDMRWQNIELADKIYKGNTTVQHIYHKLINIYKKGQKLESKDHEHFYFIVALTLVEHLFSLLNKKKKRSKGKLLELNKYQGLSFDIGDD